MIKSIEEYYQKLDYIDSMFDKILLKQTLSDKEDENIKNYLLLIKEYEDNFYNIKKEDI